MTLPGMSATSGPSYGPGGLEVPGSRKDLTSIYYSQQNGSLVKFGKGGRDGLGGAGGRGSAYERGGDWLRHNDGPGGQAMQETILRGVDTSKFKLGFTRRQYGDIQQDVLRKEQEAVKADASTRHLERRRERLSQLNQYNGFNPITGIVDKTRGVKKDENNWLLDGKPSKIQVGEGPSTELQRIGHINLRDSKSRFFLPHYSGPNHEARQQMMVTEGLKESKSSSILGVGNKDMMSYGVEDQFSKAMYEPNRMCATEGLVETTAAGRFTPEKTGVWSLKREPYGSLMSKLSVTRSTGHLPPATTKYVPPPQRSAFGVAMSNMGGSQFGGSQGGGSQYGGSQYGGSQGGGSARGFVAPTSSRGRAMEELRQEVQGLR